MPKNIYSTRDVAKYSCCIQQVDRSEIEHQQKGKRVQFNHFVGLKMHIYCKYRENW